MNISTQNNAEITLRAKRKYAYIIASIVSLLVIAAGSWIIHYTKSNISTDIAYVGAHIVEIKSPSNGFLRASHLQDSQIYHEGDSIFVVDADSVDNDYIHKLEIQLENVMRDIRDGDISLSVALVEVKKSEETLNYAKQRSHYAGIEFQRQLQLQHKGLSVPSSVELATLKNQEATSDLKKAALANEIAALQVTQIKERISTRKLQLDQVNLEIKIAKKKLLRNHIIAQHDMTVAKSLREDGDWVSQGDVVFLGYKTEKTWVDAYIDERHINKLSSGMSVKIEFDSIEDSVYEGKISSISSVGGGVLAPLSPNYSSGHVLRVTQRYIARIPTETIRCIQCEHSTLREKPIIKPGMSAHVHIQIP